MNRLFVARTDEKDDERIFGSVENYLCGIFDFVVAQYKFIYNIKYLQESEFITLG